MEPLHHEEVEGGGLLFLAQLINKHVGLLTASLPCVIQTLGDHIDLLARIIAHTQVDRGLATVFFCFCVRFKCVNQMVISY